MRTLFMALFAGAISATAFAQTTDPATPTTTATPTATATPATAATGTPRFKPASTKAPQSDNRSAFLGSVYLGEVVDTFAADELLQYINPEDANTQELRAIAGVDFQYRLAGNADSPRQWWVFGETVHGVRSRDVDCKETNNVKLSVCDDAGPIPGNASPEQFIAILRAARSLEAFVGTRYEFPPPLQSGSDSPARLYVSGQLGFLSVAGGGGDAIDDHSLNFGARAVGGRFTGSHLQIGYGRNDLFKRNGNGRFLIDAIMSIDPQYVPLFNRLNTDKLRPFLQFTGSFDGGGGSDSIQTWFGFDYEFRDLFGTDSR